MGVIINVADICLCMSTVTRANYCVMFQLSLELMLSWMSYQSMMSIRVKTESWTSHEIFFLPVLVLKFSKSWMRSCTALAYRRDWLWWRKPTALLSISSVWHCLHLQGCVINGTVDNSVTLSNLSLLSSQVPLVKYASRGSCGHKLTMNDLRSFSVLCQVSW